VRLGKLPMARKTLFGRRYNFSKRDSAANSQAGQAQVITDLIRALWRVCLMLAFNRSLLNREYILINVLKELASVISMCNLHKVPSYPPHCTIYI
jgi:hypothetical protein